jgi:hypothetical protein
MFETTYSGAAARSTSAFIAPPAQWGSVLDAWADAGRALELAHQAPAPINQTVRIALVLALVVTARLCAAWVLG